MSFLPSQKIKQRTLVFFLCFFLISPLFNIFLVSPVEAQTPTPAAPGLARGAIGADWKFDPVVDEVGKNSERARELLYWVFSHPASNRVAVLAKMWSISRNIVYLFFLLVLAAGGIGFIVAKRQGSIGPIFSGVSPPFFGFQIPSFILKVAVLLFYVTFSYVFVLGLMEFAQILMNFSIRTLGGCNLFNIRFGGGGSKCIFPGDSQYLPMVKEMEKNYIEFIGYRDFNAANQEMANTSIFFIRLTSLTYNAMSIMVILRDVILWFLLIISPFLALLMPFYLVRNIGWIWIGTFLQWLFYGPLFALFIVGIVKIWEAGIPYSFDFSRTPVYFNEAGKTVCEVVPYKTAINILWGGPAQTLSQCNSANYVDTYAEYIVSLVMLWGAILLPWLLLRIFRDYCCDVLRQNQATLQAILGKLRTPPPAAPTPKPAVPTGKAEITMGLPFREISKHETEIREKESQRVLIERMREIKTIKTTDLKKIMKISVESLRDIARFDTNTIQREQAKATLNKLANPTRISDMEERQQYTKLRSELVARATKGDVAATQILRSASQPTIHDLAVPASIATSTQIMSSQIGQIAQAAQVPSQEVASVVSMLPTISSLPQTQQVSEVVKQTNLTEEQAEKVLETIPQMGQLERPQVVLQRVPQALPQVVTATQITQTAQKAQVSEQQVSEVVRLLPTISRIESQNQIAEVSKQTSLTEEQAEKVLLTLSETSPIKPKEEISAEEKPKVTVDDYEEVKTMWLNHYRQGVIPQSEKVKSRLTWIQMDIKTITNALNLLDAKQAEMREEGVKEVEKILPFLLLGGFSNEETLVYLKAKLEAGKQALVELEKEEEIKEEAQVKAKTEEKEFVEVPEEEEKEEEKQMEAKEAQEQTIPDSDSSTAAEEVKTGKV